MLFRSEQSATGSVDLVDLIMVSLKDFDFFPKTLEDYRVRTYAGAAVSVVSMIIIVLLFISELSLYFSTTVRVLSSPSTSYCELAGRSYERGMISPQVEPHLFVDTSRGQKLRINLDITFNRLPCACMCHIIALSRAHSLNNTDGDEHVADLSVDAMDISGEAQLDVVHNIYKRRLSSTGAVIPEAEGTLHILHSGAIDRLIGVGSLVRTWVAQSSRHERSMMLPQLPHRSQCPRMPTRASRAMEQRLPDIFAAPRARAFARRTASRAGPSCRRRPSLKYAHALSRAAAYLHGSATATDLLLCCCCCGNLFSQCINEGFEENLEKVRDEGCQIHGYLYVEKVRRRRRRRGGSVQRMLQTVMCHAPARSPIHSFALDNTGCGQLPRCSW